MKPRVGVVWCACLGDAAMCVLSTRLLTRLDPT